MTVKRSNFLKNLTMKKTARSISIVLVKGYNTIPIASGLRLSLQWYNYINFNLEHTAEGREREIDR